MNISKAEKTIRARDVPLFLVLVIGHHPNEPGCYACDCGPHLIDESLRVAPTFGENQPRVARELRSASIRQFEALFGKCAVRPGVGDKMKKKDVASTELKGLEVDVNRSNFFSFES